MSQAQLLHTAQRLRELIEAEADTVDQASTLTPKVVDALVKAGLFRLLVPKDLGGMEAAPTTIVDVCEELAFADGRWAGRSPRTRPSWPRRRIASTSRYPSSASRRG